MYHIKLTDYVPEPQPATSDRIVAAHYYAAWKKGSAELHEGFDDLHEFPERTPLMGYYDEENPEVCDWEIKWAVEHGINCFIHCWYRRPWNQGKPVTLDAVRCGHGLHEAMFNAKYQKYMKFAIMYENNDRWATTDANDIVEHLMPFWHEHYFSRENYLKIDNKPVLFIYRQKRLNEVFPNPADQKAAFDACREWAKQHGYNGMIFAAEAPAASGNFQLPQSQNATARGYDFCFGYNSGYYPEAAYPDEETVLEGQCAILNERLGFDPMRYIPTASCFKDSTPRFTQRWVDIGIDMRRQKIWYLTPDGFRKVIRRMKAMTNALPDGAWGKKIFMIDNWNEWDEGHFVAPSHAYGFRYLQAIREELTERDNLPDYRMPQDLGLSERLNQSWEEPDLGPFCEARLQAQKETKLE